MDNRLDATIRQILLQLITVLAEHGIDMPHAFFWELRGIRQTNLRIDNALPILLGDLPSALVV